MEASPAPPIRQAVVTVASGPHANRLDETFTSFSKVPFLELHAFIIGERLPDRRLPGIAYHLERPDPTFQDPMRDLYYRRLLFIEELDIDYVLLVDNCDVLCLQSIPPLPCLLRGAPMAASVEHRGGYYLMGQGYTSAYLNAGVTFWHVPSSRRIREETVDRGHRRFRSIEDQLTLNEVVHTRHYDELVLLPCQYNYRAHLAPVRSRGWPTVSHLDGVRIYHNSTCVQAAKKLPQVRPLATLDDLAPDTHSLNPWKKFWAKVRNRI